MSSVCVIISTNSNPLRGMCIAFTKPPYQLGKEKSQMSDEPPHIHSQQEEVKDLFLVSSRGYEYSDDYDFYIYDSHNYPVELKAYDTVMKFLKLE